MRKSSIILQRRTGKIWEELPDHWASTINSPDKAQDPAATGPQYLTSVQVPIVLTSITLAAFLLLLDSTIVSTAVPSITSEFHSLKDVGWYGAAYQLSSAALQPLVGKLFTLFNIKVVYLSFFFVFEVGSVVCAVANSSLILIVGRVIAGLGVAGMYTGGIIIVGSCIKPESRALCTGIMMGCFYINLPLGALIFAGTAFVKLTNPSPLKPVRSILPTLHRTLDLVGFALIAPAVTLLLVALEWGGAGDYAWGSTVLIGLFWTAGVLGAAFAGWICYMGDAALIPPRLFLNRIVVACCGVTLSVMGASFVSTYWLPIYFQTIKGDSPIWSGVHLLPNVIPSLIVSIIVGALVGKVGYYLPFAAAGGAIIALAGALFTTLTPSSDVVAWAGYQVALGVGRGLAVQAGYLGMSHAVPAETLPLAVSLMIFSQYLVGSVLLTLAQVVFTTTFRAELPRRVPGVDVDVDAILNAGASGVRKAGVPLDKLADVVGAYSASVTKVFYLTAVMGVLLFVAALFSGWVDTRKKDLPPPPPPVPAQETDYGSDTELEDNLTWSDKLDEMFPRRASGSTAW